MPFNKQIQDWICFLHPSFSSVARVHPGGSGDPSGQHHTEAGETAGEIEGPGLGPGLPTPRPDLAALHSG